MSKIPKQFAQVDIDAALNSSIEKQDATDFVEMLYYYRYNASQDWFEMKILEYLSRVNNKTCLLYVDYNSDSKSYVNSKLYFLTSVISNSAKILNYYLDPAEKIQDVPLILNVFRQWMKDRNWDVFVEAMIMYLSASKETHIVKLELFQIIKKEWNTKKDLVRALGHSISDFCISLLSICKELKDTPIFADFKEKTFSFVHEYFFGARMLPLEYCKQIILKKDPWQINLLAMIEEGRDFFLENHKDFWQREYIGKRELKQLLNVLFEPALKLAVEFSETYFTEIDESVQTALTEVCTFANSPKRVRNGTTSLAKLCNFLKTRIHKALQRTINYPLSYSYDMNTAFNYLYCYATYQLNSNNFVAYDKRNGQQDFEDSTSVFFKCVETGQVVKLSFSEINRNIILQQAKAIICKENYDAEVEFTKEYFATEDSEPAVYTVQIGQYLKEELWKTGYISLTTEELEEIIKREVRATGDIPSWIHVSYGLSDKIFPGFYTLVNSCPLSAISNISFENIYPNCIDEFIHKKFLSEFFEEFYEIASSVLSLREISIIEKHLGLRENKSQTLKDIAKELGCSQQRVRQIEQKAIQKLRHPRCFYKFMKK